MKKFSLLSIAIFALTVSCEKPMSEADRNAQVEREVQQRLDAEHQVQEREKLAQQQTDLEARERALAEKEAAAKRVAAATPRATARPDEGEETQRPASTDRRSPRSYDTFYRKLEPYGAWRETGDYGYVWQPRASQQSRDWRPYTDGRWAYTDAGWTWVSGEPFGWATYHYGRWTRLRGVGWVWVPGEEWAPAWVSWRTSNQHVGWAPLPPEARFEHRTGIKKWADSYYDIGADEYVFIPNEDIGAENIGSSVIPVERNVTIVNETTNVTNITYNNTTIVNEGPNYDELRGRSRRPVDRLRLEREYNIEEDQNPQATVRGNVLAIMTPLFSARATQRPRNVGAPIPHAIVERNWATNANQPEAQRARAKMKSESAPPSDAPSKTFVKPVVAEGTPAPAAGASVVPPVVATVAPMMTPIPVPSAPPALTPKPTETPRVAPRATPLAQASAAANPVSTSTPKPTAMPVASIAPVATPVATAMPAPTRGLSDPPEKITDDNPQAGGGKGHDLRTPRGGAQDEERRIRRPRDVIPRLPASPVATPPPAVAPVAPKAVAPLPTAAPAVVREPMDTGPNLKEAGRRVMPPAPPTRAPVAEPPIVPSTPAPLPPTPELKPTPAAEKAKAADDGREAEDLKAKPEGANEP